jgi:pimeloyl-ACP methyl ester carboxylesterase
MERLISRDHTTIALDDEAGSAIAVVGLHGLTATRRYVLMGSRTLERAGHRVILFDARGHGGSSPAADHDYSYGALAEDLGAVLDGVDVDRAVLVGASMGAQTAVRFALSHPGRVAGLVLVTPAYDPRRFPSGLDRWDALSKGLRDGGIEGFLAVYDTSRLPAAWRDTLATVIAQRMAGHEHPLAVADALSAVPRSRPFESFEQLGSITVPTLVVGSRDEADPEHPLATAHAYVAAIPAAELLVEEDGRSPLAWQGGQLSRAVAELAARVVSS